MHSEQLLEDGRGRIVALYDKKRQVAERLQDELATDAQVFEDSQTLLTSAQIDAAIVSSPPTVHFEQILACRRQGLHVLCEQPLADKRDQILTLIKQANQGDPVLSIAFQRRYWAVYRKLRQEVQSGRWGDVRAVNAHMMQNWQETIAGTWRDDPNINVGGFIRDAGSHKIDTVFFVTGLLPTELSASTDFCGSCVEISAKIEAQLQGGVPLRMSFTGNAQSCNEDLFVHCADGILILRSGKLQIAAKNRIETIDFNDTEADLNGDSLPVVDSNPVSGFLDLLQKNGPNVAPPECALPVFDFTQAVTESSECGEVVPISTTGIR